MDITEQIINNPEGGTVRLDGGELPVTGYFVGGYINPFTLALDERFSPDTGWNLQTFTDFALNFGAEFIGWWTDEETEKLWVDATTWHATELEAGLIGRRRREIAIYDIARQCELRLAYAEGK